MTANTAQALLSIRNLHVAFRTDDACVQAVNGVNLSIYPRQTLAVVGESGSGKSVTALSILGLIPDPPGRITAGSIRLGGAELVGASDRVLRSVRGNEAAMIFQEPMTSLNPVYTIGWQILEAIQLHQKMSRSEAIAMAEDSLRAVGIAEPARRLEEYPHQLSGGMRQRAMIAMALACNPRLLIADEPTTALDVTIQAQILELLRRLQRERDMSIMLITHDLGVVAENADVVAVMYAGRIVEYGSVEDVFDDPQHPYTRGLFRSMPRLGEDRHRLEVIPGQVPNPAALPRGCPFWPRCDLTRQIGKRQATEGQTADRPGAERQSGEDLIARHCVESDPPLRRIKAGHWAACWFVENHEHAAESIPDVTFRREEAEAAAGG